MWLVRVKPASDEEDLPVQLTAADLHQACQLQVRSQLMSSPAERRTVPRRGMDALVLPAHSATLLRRIVDYERARRVLQGQWGFDEAAEYEGGTTCLFVGPRGSGKTIAAEAVAYELARPLRIMSVMEVLARKQNIPELLQETRQAQVVLVLEGAEILFTEAAGVTNASFLLFHVERAGGVVILCSTMGADAVPAHRLKFQVPFPQPNAELRGKLWRRLLPAKAPLCADVDFDRLGKDFELDGAAVRSAILRAAAVAALRTDGDGKAISMVDLRQAAQEEDAHRRRASAPGMYV